MCDLHESPKTAETGSNGEPAGIAALRAAAEGALETGRALEASQRRDARGRFVRGAKAGPGRPRKERAAEPAEDPAERRKVDLFHAAGLYLRRRELHELQAAWQLAIAEEQPWMIEQLVLEDVLAGQVVPAFVWDHLGAEREAVVRERIAAERGARG